MPVLFSIFSVFTAGLTLFLYWLGFAKFFFWQYPWLDIPLHVTGGLTIGLWGIALAWKRSYTHYQAFFFVLLLALGIGSMWEIFEYVSGLTSGETGYWFDTLKDLSDNIVGAMIGWVLYILLRPKKITSQ